MMRPACAYPTVVQPGPNCPDGYVVEREAFGIASMQPLPAGQGFYPVGHAGSVGMLNTSTSPSTFTPQQHNTSFPIAAAAAYSSMPMQTTFANPAGAVDVIPTGHMAPVFHSQSSNQYHPHQTMISANGDKFFAAAPSSSMGYTRGSTMSNGVPNPSQPTSTASSFGTGPNPPVHRLPVGSASTVRGFPQQQQQQQQQQMYAYPVGTSVALPVVSCGGNVSVPYSVAFQNQGDLSTVTNKSPGSCTPVSSAAAPGACGPGPRSATVMAISPQQSAVFGIQPSRQQPTAYTNQSYSARSGTLTAAPTTMSVVSRPPADRSPLSKDPQLSGNVVGAPSNYTLSAQSAFHSCSSPNSCSHCPPPKGSRSAGAGGATVFSQYVPTSMVGMHNSITPPTGLVINGPGHPMMQSGMLPPMNGCMGVVGPDNDGKLVPGAPDNCYLQTRPMSSGTRDMPASSMSMPGQVGNGSEMLISSAFPMSNNMNSPVNLPYATNPQQIPVFSGDFDSLSSNPSPMVMMAMPVSSPVPGGPMLNGSVPPGMMNMAPAPPPYHQASTIIGCRPVGPTSFFGHPQMSCLPSAPGLPPTHARVPCTDAGMGGLPAERHFLGPAGDTAATAGKRTPTGSTKSAVRPKRSRTAKAGTGTGRSNKANSKKSSVTPSAPTSMPSMVDPFGMNVRLTSQPCVRLKPGAWGSTNDGTVLSHGLTSPPMSAIVSSMDSRQNCGSPMSSYPPHASLMRPNSGPPLNSPFGPMVPGGGAGSHVTVASPSETYTRLSSPRLFSTTSSQQTQCLVSTSAATATFHSNCATQPSISSQFAAVYTAAPDQTGNGSRPSSSIGAPQAVTQPPARALSTAGIGPGMSYTSELPSSADRLSGAAACFSPPGSGVSEAPITNFSGDTDRLVCPITNGMVWGPTQLQLNDVMHQFIPDGIIVRRFEFDLTSNHLNIIVGRSDLDIVVCSHLLSEPLQVCHWPSDAVQIRFNEYMLRLDRSSVHGGQSAHKVACVKQLCRPGRNQLEIAVLGLGEDPNLAATINRRRAINATLEAHRFAAFMAHMPALNVLLDGLKRRRPAGVNALCELLDSGAAARTEDTTPDGADNRRPSGPVVGELNLICPVFRTRMNVPGRITGCSHVEAFDMEAFLRREVLWPRLNCPICGHKSPAGLDGLCIDTTILHISRLVPNSIDRILVRSDGYWRLPSPHYLDLPNGLDQWQPLIGPLTEVVTHCLQRLCFGMENSVLPPFSDAHSNRSPSTTTTTQPPNPANTRSNSCSAEFASSGAAAAGVTWTGKVESSPGGHGDHNNKPDYNRDLPGVDEKPTLVLPVSRPHSQPVSWSELPLPTSMPQSNVYPPVSIKPSATPPPTTTTSSPAELATQRLCPTTTGAVTHLITTTTAAATSVDQSFVPRPDSLPSGPIPQRFITHEGPSTTTHHTPVSAAAAAAAAAADHWLDRTNNSYAPARPSSSSSVPCSPSCSSSSSSLSQFTLTNSVQESRTSVPGVLTYGPAPVSQSSNTLNASPTHDPHGERKPAASSLNKGLDYLLADEHTMVNHATEGSYDCLVLQQHPSTPFGASNSGGDNKSVVNCSDSGTATPKAFGMSNGYDTMVDSHDAIGGSGGSVVPKPSNENNIPEHMANLKELGSVVAAAASAPCESLDQNGPGSDGPHNAISASPKTCGHFGEQSSTDWKQVKPEEMYAETDSYQSPRCAFTSHFDEDHLCAETIQSLSAQIDRIEIFLEDSYLQFVERFPCI